MIYTESICGEALLGTFFNQSNLYPFLVLTEKSTINNKNDDIYGKKEETNNVTFRILYVQEIVTHFI